MRLPFLRLLLLPALLALGACDKGGGGPTPPAAPGGDYAGVLVSPNPEEASAVLELTGTGIQEVRAGTGFLASSPITGGQRVVIVREVPGSLEFVVKVAAGSEPPAVRVVEVAGGDDVLRPSLAGYSVTFTRMAAQ
jgi:hypothetical protein